MTNTNLEPCPLFDHLKERIGKHQLEHITALRRVAPDRVLNDNELCAYLGTCYGRSIACGFHDYRITWKNALDIAQEYFLDSL